MRLLTILFTFSVLFFCVHSAQLSAQEKPKELIVVKMIIKREIFEQQIKIPVEESFDKSPLAGGGSITNGCFDCLLISDFEFAGFAESINQNKARVSTTVNFRNKRSCSFEDTIFIVSRNKPTKLKLKCGVEIIAHWENKTTNY